MSSHQASMMRGGPHQSLDMQPMHSGRGQLPCPPYGACEQRHAGHDQKLPILAGRKGETENAAEIFDGHHFGSKNVRYADRVDDFVTHMEPLPNETTAGGCAPTGALAMLCNRKGESDQAFSGGYPQYLRGMVDVTQRQNPGMERLTCVSLTGQEG